MDLHKAYGEVEANRGISLSVAPGTIHAVVGENGAGKSTLMRMLQGSERPDSGHVVIDNAPVTLSGPADALNRGIGMVHQEFMMAPDLTLLENLALGEEPVRWRLGPLSAIDWRRAEAEGAALAARIGAEIDWHRRTSAVPVHVLQFVEIIRLLRRGCRVLILDEPTAVLAPLQVEELFALLRSLAQQGTTILFISHKIHEVMALADRVTVIRAGRTVFDAEIDETDAHEIAGHIVRGERPAGPPPEATETRRASGAPVLKVRGLSAPSVEKSQALDAIDLTVHAGEILGLAGVSGNGQVELVEALAGLRATASGTIRLGAREIDGLSVAGRRAAGLSYVSADRAHEGLSTASSIEDNVVAGSHRAPPLTGSHGFGRFTLRRGALRRMAETRMAELAVTFGRLSDAASSLSGGNQQKLVFAREIAGQPALLIASQPTRGVDLNGIAAIHGLILAFRAAGGAVLLASEELDELEALSDRIAVIAGGRIVGDVADPSARGQIGQMMVMGAMA
ncbi:MAG: ABC transporter ATP-binding protein [Pseudomonadota bacterium]